MWEDGEFSITCLDAYCFRCIFGLKNAMDQNTLANTDMGKHSLKDLYMRRVTEYICALFYESMFPSLTRE